MASYDGTLLPVTDLLLAQTVTNSAVSLWIIPTSSGSPGGGGGSAPPKTTGQIWPRGNW